jgi:hypothetical protein
LDMSIHEISICQEPANPEALIQDVNMMAKSGNEIEEQKNEVSKVLRADESAPEVQQINEQQPMGSAEEMKNYAKQLKEMQATLRSIKNSPKNILSLKRNWEKTPRREKQ